MTSATTRLLEFRMTELKRYAQPSRSTTWVQGSENLKVSYQSAFWSPLLSRNILIRHRHSSLRDGLASCFNYAQLLSCV